MKVKEVLEVLKEVNQDLPVFINVGKDDRCIVSIDYINISREDSIFIKPSVRLTLDND